QPADPHHVSASLERRQTQDGRDRGLHAKAAGHTQRHAENENAVAVFGDHHHLIFNTTALRFRCCNPLRPSASSAVSLLQSSSPSTEPPCSHASSSAPRSLRSPVAQC